MAQTTYQHPNQGVKAMPSGSQIGGTSHFTGSGSPSGVVTPLRKGDLYMDYTNNTMYYATGTTNTAWSAFAGLSSMASGATIGGTSIFTGSGTPKSVVTPVRIGDLYFDYTNAVMWAATGTTNTSWAAAVASSQGQLQSYYGTVSLAQLQAGITLIPAVAGYTITPIFYKFVIAGTAGGSGNLVLEDTNGTPVVITTITEAALNTAGNGGVLSSEQVVSGKTDGAGMCAPLTAAKGIQIAAAAGITTLTSIFVCIEYILS